MYFRKALAAFSSDRILFQSSLKMSGIVTLCGKEDDKAVLMPMQREVVEMRYVMITPGGTVQYDVPVMKVQAYTLDEIFEKHLLIPFYIFSHEKSFLEYNSNEQKLEELESEYQVILERLDKLEQQGFIGAFDKRTIIELYGDVIREITQKYVNVQKGVGDMMSGALIETEARTILNQGIQQGIQQGKSQGENETKKKTALIMLQDGELSIDKIARYSGLEVEEVERLAEIRTV